jgi:DNA mismatch repair protein MutL
MSDIIRLLPDHVANQIAAGEVVQRPSSVVKELLENGIDAGATSLRLTLKDAGRTLIQVSDNGKGMSETDARVAFERHATSKISAAEDLFHIQTLGFRGEALASIASVAQVELKTKREEDSLGTHIIIEGNEVKSQQPTQCPKGATFWVKNLFYNIPARRNFLKADQVELRHIIEEFERVALVQFRVEMILEHNGKTLFHLPASNLKQRIINLFGSQLNQRLIPIETDTDLISIEGFIVRPEYAKKTKGEQYFFANGRFVKMAYLNHAVESAYQALIPEKSYPSYFIFFNVDPANIDVNIHPTKTEIKLLDEKPIYAILSAAVKKGLGMFSIGNTLDFESESIFNNLPTADTQKNYQQPTISFNPDYNPFNSTSKPAFNSTHKNPSSGIKSNWKDLFPSDKFDAAPINPSPNTERFAPEVPKTGSDNESFKITEDKPLLQVKNKYIIANVRSGLMIIDQNRASQRVLFEKALNRLNNTAGTIQQLLFPENLYIKPADIDLLHQALPGLRHLGFDIQILGINTFVVNGIPTLLPITDVASTIEQIIEEYRSSNQDINNIHFNGLLALGLAKSNAIKEGQTLSREEMQQLIDQLFACEMPNVAPDGAITVKIFDISEIEKLMK